MQDSTGSGEPFFELKVDITPNPTRGRANFSIYGAGVQPIFIDCYDNLGRLVLSYTGVGIQHTLDVSRLANALYFCKVSSGDLTKVVKIIVQ